MKFNLSAYIQYRTHQPAATHSATSQPSHRRPAECKPNYQRSRDLPRLIAATPDMLDTPTKANRALLIRLIKNELRKERMNIQLRTRLYQVERHLLLVQALKAELNPAGQGENTSLTKEPRIREHGPSTIKKRRLLLRDSVFKHFNSRE